MRYKGSLIQNDIPFNIRIRRLLNLETVLNNRGSDRGAEVVNEEVNCVSRKEVKNVLKKMKKAKAVGPYELPVKVWKCMEKMGIKFLTRQFNRLLMGKRMPEEWRTNVLIPLYKNKGMHSAVETTEE